MAEEPAPLPLPDVPASAIAQQFKGQLRIAVAAVAGSLVTAAAAKLHLPILTTFWGVQGDQIVGMITGIILLGLMAAWQWVRARIVHSRFWALATNPRVPNDIIKPVASTPLSPAVDSQAGSGGSNA